MCIRIMYHGYMRKTQVEIDDEALAAAQRELGTTTMKDTINEALRLVATRQTRARALLGEYDNEQYPWVHLGIGSDIGDPEIMRQARR